MPKARTRMLGLGWTTTMDPSPSEGFSHQERISDGVLFCSQGVIKVKSSAYAVRHKGSADN